MQPQFHAVRAFFATENQAKRQAKFKQSLKGGAQAIASGPLLKPTSTSTPTSTTTTTTISDTHIQIHTGGTPPPNPLCVLFFVGLFVFVGGRTGRTRQAEQPGRSHARGRIIRVENGENGGGEGAYQILAV